MNLEKFLQNFGLTETESRVYLTTLKKPDFIVSELAKITKLKRPAIYHALETLEKKGLVNIINKKKILRYRAEPPEQLKTILKRKTHEIEKLEKNIEKALPLFPNTTELTKSEVNVEFFRGKESIKNLAEKSLRNDKKEIFTIVPSFKIFLETFSKEFAIYYINKKKNLGIVSRSVWAQKITTTNKQYSELYNHKEFLRDIRFAPKSISQKFKSIILTWDNNVAIINTSSELFGVLITSQDYAETMKSVWSIVWEASSPPKI